MRHTANIKTATVNKVAGLSKQAERDALARDFGLESFTPQPGMIYTRVRAISARVNRNFDGFESSELKRAYTTFEGRPVFVNHENHDPTRTRGIVVASAYREDNDDRYIELLIEVDAQAFPKLAQEIADGNIDSVSMGCEVESTICSYCGNEADDLGDFCEHVLHHKGQTLQRAAANGEVEDVLVYEICRGVNFFEISFVFDPADETALAQTVLDARTARRKRAYDDRVAPQQVDTLTNSDPCPACGAEDFNGTQCRWCDYVTPPKELQDPDTSKAKEHDLRNEPEGDHGDDPDTDQEDHTMPRNPRDRQAAIRRLAEVNRAIAAHRKRASLPPTVDIKGGTYNIIQDGDDVHLENAVNGDYVGVVSKPGGFSSADEVKTYALDSLAQFAPDWDEVDEVSAGRRAHRKRASIPPVDGWESVPGGLISQETSRVRITLNPDTGMYDLEVFPSGPGEPELVGTYATLSEAVNDGTGQVMTLTARRRKRASGHKGSFNSYTDWSDFSGGGETGYIVDTSDGGTYYVVTTDGGASWSVYFEPLVGDMVTVQTDIPDPDVAKAWAGHHQFKRLPNAYGRRSARRNNTNREVNMNHRTRTARRRKRAGASDEVSALGLKSADGLIGQDGSQYIDNQGRVLTLYLEGDAYAELVDAETYEVVVNFENSNEAVEALQGAGITARRKRASLDWAQVASDVASAYDDKGHYIEVWYHQDEGWDYAIYTDTDGGREMTVPRGSSPMFDTLEEAKSAAESAVQGLTIASRKRATRHKQASELEPDEIPADFPVKPLGTQAEIDAAGDPVQDGECGLWWDDAISTSYTPAPGGRCPFEDFHDYDDDGYYANRKRADADTDAAQPDERVDLDETGDPVNSNADEEAAKPDERVDVTTPDETQPADAADSQYDPTEYENQGGAPVKASAMQALALIEAYEEHGIITNDERLAKFAELEKTSAIIVQDRLDLLAQVKAAGAKAPTRTAKRSTVPRPATPQRLNPSMGRAASTGDAQLPDYLITL